MTPTMEKLILDHVEEMASFLEHKVLNSVTEATISNVGNRGIRENEVIPVYAYEILEAKAFTKELLRFTENYLSSQKHRGKKPTSKVVSLIFPK